MTKDLAYYGFRERFYLDGIHTYTSLQDILTNDLHMSWDTSQLWIIGLVKGLYDLDDLNDAIDGYIYELPEGVEDP